MGTILLTLFLFSGITPKEELRFNHVYEQQQDTSCGYSILGTLLSLYWNISVTEEELIARALGERRGAANIGTIEHNTPSSAGAGKDNKAPGTAPGDDTTPAVRGASDYSVTLLTLARLLAEYGLQSRGFTMNYEELKHAALTHAPLLVHYTKPEKHFALCLGFLHGYALMVDPARGVELLTHSQLLKRWSGAVLAAASITETKNTERLTRVMSLESERLELLQEVLWLDGFLSR